MTSCLGVAAGAALAVSVDVGAPAPLADRDRPVAQVTARLPGPLPFPAASFDVVVTLETIEHVLDPDALLEEAHRVLVPGGTLVLSTPRLDSFLVVGSLLLGVQPPGVECSSRRRYGSPLGEQRPSGHVHLFTRRALGEALAANGFRLDAYREARFSSSWWQAVRSDRRPRPLDLALRAGFAVYDLVPFRKDVMVVRAMKILMPDQLDYQRAAYDDHYPKMAAAVREQLAHPLLCSFYDRLAGVDPRRPARLGPARRYRVLEAGCGEGLVASAVQRVGPVTGASTWPTPAPT